MSRDGHEASGPPTLDSVREAAALLEGIANRTPVITSRTLNARTGARVFLKCESFQRSGSFKFRGAYNAVSRLSREERERGVVAYSSGNHAQAIALVTSILEVPVTVVMPKSAPRAKRAAAAGYGAEIVEYDPESETREAIAAELQRERELTLIPPYDHPLIAAGQGTAALELIEEVPDLDVLLVQCGGGGLLSGSALAAIAAPGCRVIGVEPEVADDATRTFRTGTIQTVRNPPTIADGLRTPYLGKVTWPIIRERVSDMVTVSEGSIVEAMRFLWMRMKLVVEPSGAVALAALLERPDLGAGRRVGVMVSGGNVDLASVCTLLDSPSPTDEYG